jgi:tetratricopeptide (TPR) repeat protein
LEENQGTLETVREAYEKAITNIPPISEKRYWRRYIFLWINYAVYEEYTAKDCERVKEIYRKALEIIPHEKFTFSKLWILYAHFYIRMKNLEQARKVFGMSIAKCPREKIFKAYIELELQLGNVDKCRQIYEKFISIQPDNSGIWVKYAELEKSLDEYDRCIAIFQAAVTQPLDMPEIVWKAYINVEITYKKFDNVRNLYEILLEKTRHVKVWLSYAKFEQEVIEFEKSRDIFDRAYKYFKEANLKEERLMILENSIKTEENNLVNFLSNNLISINYENEEDDEEQNVDENNSKKPKFNSVLEEEAIEEKIKNFDFEYHVNKTQEVIKMLLQLRPEKIKKRRRIASGIGKIQEFNAENNKNFDENANEEEGWEEYYVYIFPDDEDNKKNFKILSHALKWHQEAGKGKN